MTNFRKRPTYTDSSNVTKKLLIEGEVTNTPIVQTTGSSVTDVMSQDAVTRNLGLKADKTNTISINGLAKKLGDNPVFDVVDEDYVLFAISQIMNIAVDAFTITFNAGGGAGAPNAIIDWLLTTRRKLPERGLLVRAGYTFIGWGKETGGVIWESGAMVRLSKLPNSNTNISYTESTLFAKWVPN